MKKFCTNFCLLLLFIYSGGFSYANIPSSERTVLIALYNATNGDNWTDNSGWKRPPLHTDGFAMPGTEGNWYGIVVEGDSLLEIHLQQNNLTGIIPAELGNLTSLIYLFLHNNQLTGGIPSQLGNLTKLRTLYLAGNQLSGSIPPSLEHLKNLWTLSFYSNQLTGGIPSELGKLTNLHTLSLAHNQLTGGIPPSLGSLINLTNLALHCNQLTGGIPPSLGNLRNLYSLLLWGNQLTGSIPLEIGSLTSLEVLSLSNNQLTGEIPSTFTGLTNLKNLRLSFNNLSGSLPPYLGSLVNLEYLVLQANYFSGEIPITLMDLPNVVDVSLGINCLYTNDDNLRIWLTGFDENWESYQTGCSGGGEPPFGAFETPADGSIVSGSVSVTGWALDDISVDWVKIYRGETGSLIYIGEAHFVEGARPDVEATYPTYPNASRAGWGYMLLTNFLPDGGNGTFKLHAIAKDVVGIEVTLGTKNIICDNANAVKPFGAIDTPLQGGTASGADYINWGWVLTPQPFSIPTDGSTIDVWVDGINLGHPVYNLYRADIATLFPGYANSDGAVGYFRLDTTAFSNGLHTIQWTATDTGGNSDGIGSRYFTIQNSNGDIGLQRRIILKKHNLAQIPIDKAQPVYFREGFSKKDKTREVYPDKEGKITLKMAQNQRLEISFLDKEFAPHQIDIYQVIENQLRKPPAGMFIDYETNTLNWMPGPVYLGLYQLALFTKDKSGLIRKKIIYVEISPRTRIGK